MGNIQCCGLSIQQIKNEIQAHQRALLALSTVTHGGTGHGTGILIHRALVLTSHEAFPTHTNAGEIAVKDDRAPTQRTVLRRRLLPSRQFITNAGLGVTLVACDPVSADQVDPLGLGLAQVTKGMNRGHRIFLLGHLKEGSRKGLITLGEGQITKEDEIIIKFSTAGDLWAPGSAGFDERGEFAFMVCNPKEPPDKKQPPKEESGQSGILVQAIRRWLKQNWQDNFDELVKPGGTGIPSSDPLPEFYTIQTVPTKKQHWLASYEKSPTELELSKASDSGQSDASSKESATKAGGTAETLGSAEWLERLASPRQEQCTKIGKEKKCREMYEQRSESPESVSPGSARSGEEKEADLPRLTIPLRQNATDMSVESKHSDQSSPSSPGTKSRAKVDRSRRSKSPQSKVDNLPDVVTPQAEVNKSPEIGTPERSKEEQVQGIVTPPKFQQTRSSTSRSPPQRSRSPSPPKQEDKKVAAKTETDVESHVREEEAVKRRKGSRVTARQRGRKRAKSLRASHVRREDGEKLKSARILNRSLESLNPSPIRNNCQKQSQSGCFSGGLLSPAQSKKAVTRQGVSTSEKKRPSGFSFCGSGAGSTRESSPLRKYPKASPDTKDSASTSRKPSASDANIKNAKYSLGGCYNSGGSRKERIPRRSASPISSDEPGPLDRRKRTSEEQEWARYVHGVEMARRKSKIVKARKDAATLNRTASGFPNEDHRTPEESPPESPGPRLSQGMPNCSKQNREERAWDIDHVEENFDVYLPPKLTASAAKKVTERLHRSTKRCTKNEREQRQWREDHMNTFRSVLAADGPFWDRLSRQETNCSRSRRQEKGITSCWSSDSEMDERKAKEGSMFKSCLGGPSRKSSPRAKTGRTSINRLVKREPRCRKSKKEDDRWARSHRHRKRKKPTLSSYGDPSKKIASSNLPKVDPHGIKRKEDHRQDIKTGPTSRGGSPKRLSSAPSAHSSRQSPEKPRCHNHAKEQKEWFRFHEDYWDDEGKMKKKKRTKKKIESSVKKGTKGNCVSCKSSTSDDNKSTVSCWSTKSDQANGSRPQTPKGHLTVKMPTDSQRAPSPASESAEDRPERLEANSHDPIKGKSPLKPSKSPQSTVGSDTSDPSSASTQSTSAHRTVTVSTATTRSASPRPDSEDELLTRGRQGEGSSTPPSKGRGNNSDISQSLTHKGTQQPESSDKGSQEPAVTTAADGVEGQSNQGVLYTPRSSRPATPPGPS